MSFSIEPVRAPQILLKIDRFRARWSPESPVNTPDHTLSSFAFTKFILQYERVIGNGHPDGAGPGGNNAKNLPALPGRAGTDHRKWK